MREAAVTRKTAETDIAATLILDGQGQATIATGIGFFDHMLTLFTKHGLCDLSLKAKGDLEVDGHHTVEDVGIVLGQLLKDCLGDKQGIRRYGTAYVPMDEALVLVSLDISGRPYLAYDLPVQAEQIGSFATELTEEFFRAVAAHAGLTLHIRLLAGTNSHHIVEAVFKAFGRAIDEATRQDARIQGVLSTKGMLE
ncbi:imidazoleglycerol-phosphate dehydratase [Sporomusaceae bacterium BoRhaA]|uniref:imidazoleglycerol-phosphate dehydratase HisB n=1 Tax=Pelorhabdus rhamnosifermentans TaxID=2772457 RepID=UPI001C0608B6|nr:imidazoleglycerol-phosphate dehydratase HisB [Pelorhabdus rhamnosifermentans]MBU2702635.1 imidazoleglycerol-phosphate dehydratase [Pelorhabdus rhamnosifermentans]